MTALEKLKIFCAPTLNAYARAAQHIQQPGMERIKKSVESLKNQIELVIDEIPEVEEDLSPMLTDCYQIIRHIENNSRKH